MGWVPFGLLMNVPLKRLVALAFVEFTAGTPFTAVNVESEMVKVPVNAFETANPKPPVPGFKVLEEILTIPELAF